MFVTYDNIMNSVAVVGVPVFLLYVYALTGNKKKSSATSLSPFLICYPDGTTEQVWGDDISDALYRSNITYTELEKANASIIPFKLKSSPRWKN